MRNSVSRTQMLTHQPNKLICKQFHTTPSQHTTARDQKSFGVQHRHAENTKKRGSNTPMTTPSLERTFRGHRNGVLSGSFHPSRQQLATGSLDGNVMVWSSKPTMRAFRFVGHRGPVIDVDFNNQGTLIASASADANVRLWVPSVRGESSVIKAHNGTVRSARFSHDGNQLLTCSDDKSVKLWSVATQRFVSSYLGHQNWVMCCGLTSESRVGVSGGDDKTVQIWDVASRKNIHTFYEHIDSVTCVSFHPDGNCVAAGSADRTVNLWDLRMNRLLQHYDAHGAAVTSIDFDCTGSWLLSSSRDGTAKLWDLKEGYHYCTVAAHEGPVLGARFSPCSRQFVTTGQDGLVMVWSTNLPGSVDDHVPTGRKHAEASISKGLLRSPSAPNVTTSAMLGSSRPRTASSFGRPLSTAGSTAERLDARPRTSFPADEGSRRVRPNSAFTRNIPHHDSTHNNNSSKTTHSHHDRDRRVGSKKEVTIASDTLSPSDATTHQAREASSTRKYHKGISEALIPNSPTDSSVAAARHDGGALREEDIADGDAPTPRVVVREGPPKDGAIAVLTVQMRTMEERNSAQELEIKKLHEALLIQQQIVQDLYARLGSAPSVSE